MPMHLPRRAACRAVRLAALTVCLGFGLGCTEEGDTIVVDGLDCGLIRNDLLGDWNVSFVPGGATLLNCDDALFDGTLVSLTAGPVSYANVSVFASASSTSFLILFDDPGTPQDDLIGSVEADSCLALVQLWEDDDGAWMQCIGTFDRSNRTLGVVCDSADLDSDGNGSPDVACDLNLSLFADILVQ
jgi:hypothetical protein